MRHTQELRPRIGKAHEPLSPQAKRSAVMALCLRRGSAKTVAEKLGVSRPSLCKWKNRLLSNEGKFRRVSLAAPEAKSPS